MAEKLIVIIGATGIQGGSVVDTLLQDKSWKIRGLTRNVDGQAARELEAKGVQVVAADTTDKSSLLAAFKGAHSIFGMTDFWAHDYDLEQGKNIFWAASETVGLQRLVFSALPYSSKWSKGKYTHVYHFDAGARAVEFAQAHYPELMKKTSLIQLGMYLTNTLIMPQYQPKKDEKGVYVFETMIPRDAKVPFVAPRLDTGPLVKSLLDQPPQKHVLAYRERLMSFSEYAEIWGETLGVQAKYVEAPSDGVWAGLPDSIRLDIEEGAAYVGEFGYHGGDPSIIYPPQLNSALSLGTVQDWIRSQGWSHVL